MIASTLVILSALALLSASAPVEPQGSKHVVYLSTCAPEDCSVFCEPGEYNIVAAGYFANGPPKSATATPTTLGTLSNSNNAWDGAKRTVRLGSTGSLATNIQAGAKKLPQSEIAGDATLTGRGEGAVSEPYACFRDATTKFRANYDGERYRCTADFYCASLDLGV
ncbi:hypothetical protein CC80DRAFT_544494 [Byssothecium circinans]|uniref:Uncharacterized protein n=1 Tax=Byssothecium circinans TaxID=147558 RepID=A0A6A5U6S8_9PLEO|nr:hypothetical protein CC80DRAFT_544494 [Byssothecium circinans]